MDQMFERLLRLLKTQFGQFVDELFKYSEDDSPYNESRQSKKTREEYYREAYRRFNEEFRAGNTGAGGGKSGRGGSSGPEDRMAFYFSLLDIPRDSDEANVKRAYREKLRKYHPDKFESDPNKRQVATDVTTKLNEAYDAIIKHLRAGGR